MTDANQPTRSGARGRLYEIIFKADTPAGKAFDVVLIVCILLSVGVVMLESVRNIREQHAPLLRATEWVFTILFTIEYILRLYCVSNKLRYAKSFFGIIDLLSILPTYLIMIPSVRVLRVIRILRVLRVFRVLKLGNHMKQADLLRNALYASRQKIIVFLCFVLTLVVIIGAVMYTIESPPADEPDPDNGFSNIPQSIYWAIVTLTTVGYGDISPQTAPGKMLAAVVMLLGYAIIAVPTGIVTAQIVQAPPKQTYSCTNCGQTQHDADASHCKKCGTAIGVK
ncbi:MAG: ion transporter [Planctomycetota bacterium]|jgi:voltage-gated potassium channel